MALAGLRRLDETTFPSIAEERKAAAKCLDRVELGTADPVERLVSHATSRQASRLFLPSLGTLVARTGLEALAAGVGGSSSQALARVGLDAASRVAASQAGTATDRMMEQRQILAGYLMAECAGSGTESVVASTALAASKQASFGWEAQTCALQALAAGIPAPVGAALAQVGLQTLQAMPQLTAGEKSAVAEQFARSIARHAPDQADEAKEALRFSRLAPNRFLALQMLQESLQRVASQGTQA
jgi:hypothetical protein